MKKKIALVVIILIGIGVYFMLQAKPQGRVSEVLSDRTREFLEKRSSDAQSEWSRQEFDGNDNEDTRNSIFNVDGCFTFIMPYKLFNQRIDGECQGYYAFNNPKGSIVVYLRPSLKSASADGGEGVSFRRQSPDIYEESRRELGGKSFLIFKNLEVPYEATAYYYQSGHILTLTLKASTTQNIDSELEEMLASIEILK